MRLCKKIKSWLKIKAPKHRKNKIHFLLKAPRQKLATKLKNSFSLIFKLGFVEHGPKNVVLLINEEIKRERTYNFISEQFLLRCSEQK